MRIKLYLPQRAAEKWTPDEGSLLSYVVTRLLNSFGGYTMVKAEGGWLNSDGVPVVEPVHIIEVVAPELSVATHYSLLQDLATTILNSGELAVLWTINDTMLEFRREGMKRWA